MNRDKIKIKSPCSQDFDEMEGEGFRRYCGQCEKHVHNLSDLNRADALKLIRDNAKGDLCVVYTFDSADRVRFRDDLGFRRPSKAQLSGLRRLIAAAAFVPLLAALPACDSTPSEEPPALFSGYEQVDAAATQDFRPIDLIMEAEERFLDKIKDLLGFVPEYEMVAGGMEMAPDPVEPERVDPELDPGCLEPSIVAPELPEPSMMIMGQMRAPDVEPPAPEPVVVPVEPTPRKMMGDMIYVPDGVDIDPTTR